MSIQQLHMVTTMNSDMIALLTSRSQLVRDATIADFDITTNDNDRNVCIQCSVGFYEAVVKPAVSSLNTGLSQQVLGVNVQCTVFRQTLDQNHSMSGSFLRFELSGEGVNPSPAPLSVHLHNTQRKLQLQGGATMPDMSRVPVWFVEYYLKGMFSSQAKAKGYKIRNINSLVKGVSSKENTSKLPSSQSQCFHCKKKFNASSKPVTCLRCSHRKHSTKCQPCPTASKHSGLCTTSAGTASHTSNSSCPAPEETIPAIPRTQSSIDQVQEPPFYVQSD